jgi:phosphatidylglycerophosphatase A
MQPCSTIKINTPSPQGDKILVNKKFHTLFVKKMILLRVSTSKIISTFFGAGLVPFAPGTFASLLTALPFCFFPVKQPIVFLFFLASFVLGIQHSQVYANSIKTTDPGEVVIDEVAGMLIIFFLCGDFSGTFAGLIKGKIHTTKNAMFFGRCVYAFLAFFFFRIFDITKPLLVGLVDRNCKGAIGIMMDDVVAGIMSAGTIYGISIALGRIFG